MSGPPLPGVPRVPRHVTQRLLGHPIQAECHVRRDLLQAGVGVECDDDPVLAAELGAVPLQRRDQPGVLEHARVQLVRQVPDRLESAIVCCCRRATLLRLSSLRRQPALEAAAGDAQGGELLADVVMQLARCGCAPLPGP